MGLDLFAHAHVLREHNAAVLLCFNLGSAPETRTVRLDLGKLGITAVEAIEGGTATRESDTIVTLQVEIPPRSPALVEINTAGSGGTPQ